MGVAPLLCNVPTLIPSLRHTSFSWPSPTSPFSSHLVSPATSPRLVHPVVLSRCLLVVLRRPVAVVVCGVVGGAAPAVAVVVLVRVGVKGTWADVAGASGAGGGGGGH